MGGETVMVVVRMRPFNTKEKNEKRGPCIQLDFKAKTVAITLMADYKPQGPPNVVFPPFLSFVTLCNVIFLEKN